MKAAAEYLKTLEEFQNRKVRTMQCNISKVIGGKGITAYGYIWKLKYQLRWLGNNKFIILY